MLSSALLSLGVAGSALAWPSVGHSRHSSIARALHARQEPAVKAKEPVAATWFASWHADEFSLANVSWNKYTTVSYSFALTTPNVSFVNISDPDVFKDFVSTAHANNVSATISIGGWTGSLYFSSAVATAENRTEFVKTMVSLLKDNNLDGLSFDWEYPNSAGIGCNTKSPNDTENFLLFLKELRTALPSNATLTAATSINPFISADGTPSTNVSEFASVFDYIQLMNYDVWGSWSDTTGPNAPLNDTCATNATQKVGSAVSAVEAWTKAGFPADQLVLGVAGYGHGFSVDPANALSDGILNPYSVFNKGKTPPGDAWDDAPVNGTVDVCGNPQAQGGNWNFWGLIEGGFLNENGTANTAEGIVYKYDECSQTPFVYNQTSGVFVSFDNAASFAAKGQFINATGLRGFAMWEAGGDYDDILLDAIRSGAGFPEVADDDYDDCYDDETGVTTPETGNTSNNSGNTSGNTGNTGSTSGNTSGNTSNNSGNTSNNSGNTSNNSGSNSSNNSGSTSNTNTGSNSGSTSTSPSNNSGSTSNSGSNNSNNSGSSNTTPDNTTTDNDEDDDCEDDEYPETTVAPTATTSTSSAKPTATASSEDDDEECEDDEYPEPAVTTSVNPTTYQAAPTVPATTPAATGTATPSTSSAQPAVTPEATIPDNDDDEECEDDEIIEVVTSVSSGTASATSTVSATSTGTTSDATVTQSASENLLASTVTQTTSTSHSTTTESFGTPSASPTMGTPSGSHTPASPSAQPTFTYQTSSSAGSASASPSVQPPYYLSSISPQSSSAPQITEPLTTTVASATHPAPSQSAGGPSSSFAPTLSEPLTTSAASTTTSSSSSAPTVSAPEPTL